MVSVSITTNSRAHATNTAHFVLVEDRAHRRDHGVERRRVRHLLIVMLSWERYGVFLAETSSEIGLIEHLVDAIHGILERFLVAGGDQHVQRLVEVRHHRLHVIVSGRAHSRSADSDGCVCVRLHLNAEGTVENGRVVDISVVRGEVDLLRQQRVAEAGHARLRGRRHYPTLAHDNTHSIWIGSSQPPALQSLPRSEGRYLKNQLKGQQERFPASAEQERAFPPVGCVCPRGGGAGIGRDPDLGPCHGSGRGDDSDRGLCDGLDLCFGRGRGSCPSCGATDSSARDDVDLRSEPVRCESLYRNQTPPPHSLHANDGLRLWRAWVASTDLRLCSQYQLESIQSADRRIRGIPETTVFSDSDPFLAFQKWRAGSRFTESFFLNLSPYLDNLEQLCISLSFLFQFSSFCC